MPKGACYCPSGAGEVSKDEKGGDRGILISDIFIANKEICGYRRIRAVLERAGQAISE